MPRKHLGQTRPLLPDADQPLLLLMDGHALVHRAWHAIQNPLTLRRTGEDVRAVFGFTNSLLKVLGEWRPTHCAIAFDLPTPTYRHQAYREYKAQRPEAPLELRGQFPRVRQLMQAFRIPIFEAEGYEADDVLGTLCRQAEEQGIPSLILTGDTDTLQLVSPLVRVLMLRGIQDQAVYDEAAVAQRYGGLKPSQQPDVKALQGDASDNIPGVPGVGTKTAIKLIQLFGSIEGLYANLDKAESPRLRQTLEEHREQARQGKELTTIARDVPIALDLSQSEFWRYDRQEVLGVLRELEFTSIVAKVPEGREPPQTTVAVTPPASEAVDYRTVDTPEELEVLVRTLKEAGPFSFDVETTGLEAMEAELVGLSFAPRPRHAFYVPVGHHDGQQLPSPRALEALGPLLEDPQLPKVAQNGKYDMLVLANNGIVVRGLAFDTMIAAHLLGEKAIGLKDLAFRRLNLEMTPITDLIGTGRKQVTMAQVPIEEVADYACADADVTLRLRDVLDADLRREGLLHLLTDVEVPLVSVLVRMERHGVALDMDLLRRMSTSLREQMARLETEIYQAVGHRFNINSPPQLGEVLYGELRLTRGKRTPTGGYSTDAQALESLKGAHPVVDLILEYRRVSKLKSTYVDALPGLVNPRTGRVHTTYHQTGTATGRISSSDPNLQNIPVRDEEGRLVRKAFVAQDAPRWLLLAADYSQIELRIMAHLTRDPGLVAAFQRGEDIHAATAAQVYNVPLDQVTSEMRRLAKVMNFGVIYGLSAFGIAQQTELTPEEGAKFIQGYFDRYPGIRQYVEETKQQARERGYVQTLLGRRRYIPEINSTNYQARQAAERMAINMPVQGAAADIVKLAMLRLDGEMLRRRLQSRMLIQVHDELIFEVPQNELEEMKGLVLDVMPRAMELALPLKVDVKTGETWGDME